MANNIRDKALKALAGKAAGFYLAGGTALSLFYFHHRESLDLDFFTKDFSRVKAGTVVGYLEKTLGLKAELVGSQMKKDKARLLVYSFGTKDKAVLKIDFVEDLFEVIKPPKIVDGIAVMSIEDIYIRKLFAACGTFGMAEPTGKKRFIGGRQDAKDFFDLYFLSKTFMPLSAFAVKYCGAAQIESIIVWYRTYDRLSIKLGLNDIMTDKRFDYQEMERYFRREVEEIVKKEI
ncbi:MAG: nucleotidyl transferase AbiEii/AbiGii toxin family protein [Candidatus Omnitrophica bacterium]|nr:nucleotidyl transferase AbiEii/AbiGii toxin family protein [Candidatus Omnitrophota bacterium]